MEGNEKSAGPFSMFRRRSRKRSEKEKSRRLRSMLGETGGFDEDDGSESGESRYSSGMSDSFSQNGGVILAGSDRTESLRARKMSNKAASDYELSDIENKSDERSVENAGNNDERQCSEKVIVKEECSGMKELTEGIENMNDTVKKNNKAAEIHCHRVEGLDSAEEIKQSGVESLLVDREERPVDAGSSSPNDEKRRRERESKTVKRKHNMFYHEMEEGGGDSGLGDRRVPSKDTSSESRAEMTTDRNGNTPGGSCTGDGLLTRFGERQSSGVARKRHIPSNASDFEGKIGSPISSRSSSTRSYASSVPASIDSGLRMGFQEPHTSVVVVAIDFGTTFSGYAFAFTRDPDSIHMMRKWEGGDPGVNNQKIPTTLLLKPDGAFHSFGYGARDFYHDLEHTEAKKWLYFEKFKMSLHSSEVC